MSLNTTLAGEQIAMLGLQRNTCRTVLASEGAPNPVCCAGLPQRR